MLLNPYLNFDGRCAEAFRFYEKALGGKIIRLDTFAGSPMADQVGPEMRDKVIHARLEVEGKLLMGSDSTAGNAKTPQGFGVALGYDDLGEAKRAFDALAEGGRIDMPLQETYFAKAFGMVVDRFAIPWLISGGSI
ncbi:MAG: VOC family protein [Caulobacteraceae bacterium]